MSSTIFFFLFIPLLAFILLAVNLVFAPHNPYMEKNSAFECGFSSFLGQNRTQFSISFFIFALLFLLFDLEILLVYPYLVSAYANGIYGLTILLIFLLALTLGFAFELGKKALYIESRQISNISKSNFISKVNANVNTCLYGGKRSYSTLNKIIVFKVTLDYLVSLTYLYFREYMEKLYLLFIIAIVLFKAMTVSTSICLSNLNLLVATFMIFYSISLYIYIGCLDRSFKYENPALYLLSCLIFLFSVIISIWSLYNGLNLYFDTYIWSMIDECYVSFKAWLGEIGNCNSKPMGSEPGPGAGPGPGPGPGPSNGGPNGPKNLPPVPDNQILKSNASEEDDNWHKNYNWYLHRYFPEGSDIERDVTQLEGRETEKDIREREQWEKEQGTQTIYNAHASNLGNQQQSHKLTEDQIELAAKYKNWLEEARNPVSMRDDPDTNFNNENNDNFD